VFGTGAATGSYDEYRDADLIIVWGSNTAECHPIVWAAMQEGLARGAELVVIDPRRIGMARRAAHYLPVRVGTDIALANAMAHVIITEGLYHRDFVAGSTENFEAYRQVVMAYPPERAEEITGVPAEDIRTVARKYARAQRASLNWTLGVTEHHNGTDTVFALINLALLTGHVGRWGSSLNPLRGQNNVQGGGDMGALPDKLPGGFYVENEEHRRRFEELWGRPIPPKRGHHVTGMFRAIEQGEIRGMYIIGENPARSEANSDRIEALLDRLEFLVVQDLFLTATAEHADVVLPAAASWIETDGTFTSGERRIQRVRKGLEPPGEARDDLEILNDIASRLDPGWKRMDAREVWEEIRRASPIHAGITYERLDREGGIQYPCWDENHPGTRVLHTRLWEDPDARAPFTPVEYRPPLEQPDEEYPLLLTTGRRLKYYNTGLQDEQPETLEDLQDGLEMHPDDARRLGLEDGQWVTVRSRRGSLVTRLMVTEDIRPGVVFLCYSYPEVLPVNRLTLDAYDPVSGVTEFKAAAVRVEPAEAADGGAPAAPAPPAASG